MDDEGRVSPLYVVIAIVLMLVVFFFGIVLIPLIALIGMVWAIAALFVRSRY